MDSIGVIIPYELPENNNFSEDEARKIINSWFESSPERKSMRKAQKSKIVNTLSTKFIKAITMKRETSAFIGEGILNSTKKSSVRQSSRGRSVKKSTQQSVRMSLSKPSSPRDHDQKFDSTHKMSTG